MSAEGKVGSKTDLTSAELASSIDHTLLRADATPLEIDSLCREAREHGFFSVCVNAVYVEECARLLASSETRVCSVVGFPLAGCGTEAKCSETRFALERGALEIDMVIQLGALKAGDRRAVSRDIQAVAELCDDADALLKVILETCLLSNDQKRLACELALDAGADFLKTSTGFSTGGATVEDVRLLREMAGPDRGVKAAGGIATLGFAEELLCAGASRLGCSRSVQLVREFADQG